MTNRSEAVVLRIDLNGTAPAYRQIVDALRAFLVAGQFKPGERLPTVRQLAIDLAVNHNTVAEAYRILADEGWLELRRHHGATVLPREPKRAAPHSQKDFTQRLRELAARALADGLDAKAIAKQLSGLARDLNRKEAL